MTGLRPRKAAESVSNIPSVGFSTTFLLAYKQPDFWPVATGWGERDPGFSLPGLKHRLCSWEVNRWAFSICFWAQWVGQAPSR